MAVCFRVSNLAWLKSSPRSTENGIDITTRSTIFVNLPVGPFSVSVKVPSELVAIAVIAVLSCTVPGASAAAIACGRRSLPPCRWFGGAEDPEVAGYRLEAEQVDHVQRALLASHVAIFDVVGDVEQPAHP